MKKKIVCLLLVTLLAFTITACGSEDSGKGSTTGDKTEDISDEIADDSDDPDNENLDENADTDNKINTIALPVYYPDKSGTGMASEIATFEQDEKMNEAEVLSALVSYGVVTSDITSNSSREETNDDGKYIMTLDLSASFTDYLNSLDADTERLIMQCIANTYIDYYAMDQLVVTVDGEALVSDHADYTQALTYTDSMTDDTAADDTDDDENSSDNQ